MKNKVGRRSGFRIVLTISYLILFSINAHGADPLINETKLEAGLRLKVKFASNSATLTRNSRRYLDKLAKQLKSPPWANEKFIIEGHTDTAGDEGHNLSLSEKRAEGVKSYLVKKHKIEPNRITIIGHGESMPLDISKTVKANRLNRRVIMRHAGGIFNRLAVKNYIVVAVLVVISGLLGKLLSHSIFRRV